jgi:hemolysin III
MNNPVSLKNIEIVREPVSGWIHSFGIPLSVAGLAVLDYIAIKNHNPWQIVSFTIFGLCLILVYTCSTLYHLLPLKPLAKIIFRKLDKSMIYLLIAGTYTPICLVAFRNTWGWSLFGIVWGLAIFGILFKWLFPKAIPSAVHVIIYLIMGWVAIVAIKPLSETLSFYSLIFLVSGGLAYTIGVIFFALEKYFPRKKHFGMHEIFHLFVFVGSFLHYMLILFIATGKSTII